MLKQPSLSIFIFQAKFKNSAIFIVVSDDLSWAKEYLPRTDVVFAGNTIVAAKDLAHPYSYSDDVGMCVYFF